MANDKDSSQTLPAVDLEDAFIQGEDRSELDKVLQEMTDPDKIHHYTQLSRAEITAFSILTPMAKRHNLIALKELLLEGLKYRVSEGRKGRMEVVKLGSRGMQVAEEKSKSWLSMFRRD